ncbi:MAG: methyltransferase domain-containing protein [Candidatus Melainabacteria bacterium]|nr:methyltransferase domain-containing protein [Candidatus Melainabacteria bacterium]
MKSETEVGVRFEEKLLRICNDAALALMISIGHRTKLFDVMSDLPPSTSEQVADRAMLNERYVREWLNACTTGGIIDYVRESQQYSLPAEHARWLVRKSAKDNLAALAQYISVLGSVETEIVDCFENGGGVPYTSFNRFHEVMAEDSGQSLVPALLESVLPLVDGLAERMNKGIDVLDIGCGRGLALMRMAGEFPNSRFVGYDFSDETIQFALQEATNRKLSNVRFEVHDVSIIEDRNRFDLITAFDAIHDQAKPLKVLENIFLALRMDGVFIMQDIDASSDVSKNVDHPIGPLLYSISCMHCMTVSLALDGEGLGTMWGRETAIDYLQKCGFQSIRIEKLDHDIQNCIYVIQKEHTLSTTLRE